MIGIMTYNSDRRPAAMIISPISRISFILVITGAVWDDRSATNNHHAKVENDKILFSKIIAIEFSGGWKLFIIVF